MAGKVIASEYCGTWSAKIEWTPASGPLAGKTLKGGEYHPSGRGKVREPCVVFKEAMARLSTNPELRDLVAQIPSVIADAQARQKEQWRIEYESRLDRVRVLQDASAYGYGLMWVHPVSGDDLKNYAEWTHGKVHHGLSHDRIVLSCSGFGASMDIAADVKLPTATMKAVMTAERNIGFVPGCGNSIYRITQEEETGILREIEEARQAKADAEESRQVADANRIRDAVEEARRTGNRVEVRRWSEPCDGSATECSLDLIVQFARPDGRLATERCHTH